MKKGFTLIELILVIVIMAIVSIITLNLTLTIYRNYVQSEVASRLAQQADLALDIIARRLDYRIKDSVIARKSSDLKFISIDDTSLNDEYDILEFIPYAHEAFDLGIYSGVIDLSASNRSNIVTPNSELGELKQLFSDLSIDNNAKNQSHIAVFLKNIYEYYNIQDGFGFAYTGKHRFQSPVLSYGSSGTRFSWTTDGGYSNATPKEISEQYHIAYNTYAVKIEEVATRTGSNKDFDLYLYTDYRPWNNHNPFAANQAVVRKSLLAQNVSSFRFRGDNGMVFLKLCLRDNKQQRRSMARGGKEFSVCRTKAVY
ncbi:PulJ/GspJ family protein [Campylobacter gastrosuis]|uniref:Type II secretion system GspH family protein n=1 Tax=Campylobacter gastrosuis TaxID=2974576 RepID=A0ABT7HQQ2_9BACT|nr:type II secretion system protein [Campylobacter gastrosuis]MDL0089169.1 type II secretion system GspH family protein [Campylobacter gastrosuis]